MDLTCSDREAWKEELSNYSKRIQSLNNPKLIELDEFYRIHLPQSIQKRHPAPYITKEELKTLMQWKLTRGKWRPRLMNFVSSLDERDVKAASQKAFASMPDLKQAVNALCTLKGVGPATASAILAAFAPHVAPFMSDEAMLACLGNSKEYTLKQYLIVAEKLQNKAKELNEQKEHEEGSDDTFTVSNIERALWSAAVGTKSAGDRLDDSAGLETKNKPNKKRKNN